MPAPGLALCLSLLLAPPQDGGGAEALAQQLEQRSAARRAQAREAWEQHGWAWLKSRHEQARELLLEQAPEIQEPLMEALWAEAAAEEPSRARLQGLLSLLGESMNAAGADRLAARRRELPADLELNVLEASLRRGGAQASLAAEAALEGGQADRRSRALAMLLRYGRVARSGAWLERPDLAALEPKLVGPALAALAERDGLPDDFRLPEAAFDLRHPDWMRGVMELLQVRPDRRAEAFLTEVAVMAAADPEDRRLALAAAEVAAAEFPWRRILRELDSFLDDYPTDPVAEDIAWTLHRLGSRAGTSYLTAELKAAVKANPGDYRSRFRMGTRYVELSMFKEAYKEFRTAIQDLEGTPQYTRIDRQTWVTASRAACGSRHFPEGLDWLKNARMSPRQLEEYRELPEFEAALAKPAFKKVFGVQ